MINKHYGVTRIGDGKIDNVSTFESFATDFLFASLPLHKLPRLGCAIAQKQMIQIPTFLKLPK